MTRIVAAAAFLFVFSTEASAQVSAAHGVAGADVFSVGWRAVNTSFSCTGPNQRGMCDGSASGAEYGIRYEHALTRRFSLWTGIAQRNAHGEEIGIEQLFVPLGARYHVLGGWYVELINSGTAVETRLIQHDAEVWSDFQAGWWSVGSGYGVLLRRGRTLEWGAAAEVHYGWGKFTEVYATDVYDLGDVTTSSLMFGIRGFLRIRPPVY